VLRNIPLFAHGVLQDLRNLAVDVRAFAANPTGFQWNRAKGSEGFLTGKTGEGVYQLHQPGLSAILFPGYFLDRQFFGRSRGYQEEFPAELPLTNTTMLVCLGVAAVALFRLLVNATGSESTAWFGALVAVASLPTSAFAFQFYPEVPALAIILTVANQVWFGPLYSARVEAGRPAPGAGRREGNGADGWARIGWHPVLAGAAVAFLPWLHPRFLAVSLALAFVGVWRSRGVTRRSLLIGYVAGLGSLLAFIYHISGSWMPDALYAASEGDVAIESSRIVGNLVAYWLHGTWGLLPHAAWLAAAPAGLAFLARSGRNDGNGRHAAVFVAAIVLALAIPASGHSLIAAAGTPGRLIMAVVPLLMWPVAVLVRRFWSSYATRAVTAGAVVLSLDAAFRYNWSHVKDFGAMRDGSASGWKPNLAFPEVRDMFDPSQAGFVLLLVVVTCLLATAAMAFVRAGVVPTERPRGTRQSVLGATLLVVATVGGAAAATASRDRWTRPEYLMNDVTAHRRAAASLVALGRCRVCFTSRSAQVDWTWLTPNPARDPLIRWAVEDRLLLLDVDLGSDAGMPGFGRLLVEFGDGSSTGWMGLLGVRELTHEYSGPGEYRLVISVELPGGLRVERPVVAVKGG